MQLNKIVCADAVNFLTSIPENSVDLIVTSPPYDNLRTYNKGHNFDFEAIAEQSYRTLKWGGDHGLGCS